MDQNQTQDNWYNSDDIFINGGYDTNSKPIYLVVGKRINENKQQKAITYFNDQIINNQAFRQYFLVLVQLEKKENDTIKFLKLLFKSTPDLQLRRLQFIYVVQPGLTFKTALYITSSITANIKAKMVYIESIDCLKREQISLSQQSLVFLNNVNQNLYQPPAPIKQFYGQGLEDYEVSFEGVPIFLSEMVKFFHQNNMYLKKEGVFRISGSIADESTLVKLLADGQYKLNSFNPDVVSSVFKNVFSKMKLPLFSYSQYQQIKGTNINLNTDQEILMWQKLISKLEDINKITLDIIRESKQSSIFNKQFQMSANNLAIVFAPCFLRPENMEMDDMIKMKIIAQHFSCLIMHQSQIFECKSTQPLKPNQQSDLVSNRARSDSNTEEIQVKMVQSIMTPSSTSRNVVFKKSEATPTIQPLYEDQARKKSKWYQLFG